MRHCDNCYCPEVPSHCIADGGSGIQSLRVVLHNRTRRDMVPGWCWNRSVHKSAQQVRTGPSDGQMMKIRYLDHHYHRSALNGFFYIREQAASPKYKVCASCRRRQSHCNITGCNCVLNQSRSHKNQQANSGLVESPSYPPATTMYTRRVERPAEERGSVIASIAVKSRHRYHHAVFFDSFVARIGEHGGNCSSRHSNIR